MKSIITLLAILGLVQSIQISNKANLIKRSGIEADNQLQWFLIDDIYIWLKCRLSNCDNKHNEGAKEPVHTPDAHTEQNDQKQPTAPEDKIAQNNSTNHGDEKKEEPKKNSTQAVGLVKETASKCGSSDLTAPEKEDCELEEKVKAAKKKDVDTAASKTVGTRESKEALKKKDMTAGSSKKEDDVPVPGPAEAAKQKREDEKDIKENGAA